SVSKHESETEAPVRPSAQADTVSLSRILAQFDIPVGEVEEVFPAIVCDGGDGDERTPLRTLRLLDEVHARLGRRAVGFARVAGNTGADNILPRGRPAAVAGDDVVEVQLAAVEMFAAIL